VMLALGILGVVNGELAAWRAKDMRRMLAFSSIGQLGMIFIALAIPEGAGLLAVLALAFHHLIIKSGLFMLADGWGGALERLRGAAKSSPLAAGLFVLFALSLIGFPPLPGFWAKFTLITELAAQTSVLYLIGLTVFLLATVIEASYLFRLAAMLYEKAPDEQRQTKTPRPAGLSLITASLFGIGLLAATLFVSPVGDLLTRVSLQTGNSALYIDTVLGGSR
jgi:formate hydrogenlyase subunit 3/multisubunit Na+/H+ antiporter MnhD subunit